MKITDLLKWGLPLFFASTTTIVDGGAADAGDAGGGGDAGDADSGLDGAGDEAGDAGDSDAEGIETDEREVEGDEAADAEASDEAEGRAGARDGKKEADAVKKTLNKIREADPEAAKTLRSAFFKQEQALAGFRRAFKTPQEAMELTEEIGSLTAYDTDGNVISGRDALPHLEREAKSYARELTAIAQGDAEIIDELAADYPDGLEKLAQPFLSKLREIRPETYDRMSARFVTDALENMGDSGVSVISSIGRALELVADGKQQAAFDQLKLIRQWFADTKKFAATKPAEKNNPAVDQRAQELERKEQAIYRGEVGKAVTNRMNTMVEKHLNPYLRDAIKAKRGLSNDQKKGLAQGIFDRLASALRADSKYQDRFKALLSEGDVNKIDRYVSSQIDLRIRKAVRAEWHSRGFAGGTPSAKGKGAAAANGAARTAGNGNSNVATRVSAKPSADQIDWGKDRNRSRYMRGEATLKNGKVVKWSWDQV